MSLIDKQIEWCVQLATEQDVPEAQTDAEETPPPELTGARDHRVKRLFRLLYGNGMVGRGCFVASTDDTTNGPVSSCVLQVCGRWAGVAQQVRSDGSRVAAWPSHIVSLQP